MGITIRNIAEGVFIEESASNVQFYPNGAKCELSDGRIKVNGREIANAVGDVDAIEDDVAGAPISVPGTLALLIAAIAPLFAKTTTDYPVSALKVVEVTYDFAVGGGTVGDVALARSIPDGAKITHVYINEDTVLTSSGNGATIELKLGGSGDGSITGVLTANNSTSGYTKEETNELKIATALRVLTVDIKVEAITAGAVTYTVMYL